MTEYRLQRPSNINALFTGCCCIGELGILLQDVIQQLGEIDRFKAYLRPRQSAVAEDLLREASG